MPRRQALGLVTAVILILLGRQVRTRMLVDDQGMWREHLWLDALVQPPGAQAATGRKKREKIVLTTDLPINTCSRDSLRLLPGVGKVMAGRIAAAREQGMVFHSAKDLRQIKGIGAKLSARLDTLILYDTSPSMVPLRPDSSLSAESTQNK